MCRKSVYLVIFVFVLAFGSVVQAGLFDPPLQNPSFESPVLDGWDFYADDWILGSRGSAYLENGGWFPSPDGINVWKLWSGANVWQQIGTWDPDTDYAISLWVGRSHDESSLSVELWAGGDPSLVPTGLEDIEGPTGHYGQIDDANGVGAILIGGADLIPTVEVGQNEWMTAILNTGSDFNADDALWLRLVSTAPDGQATYIDLVEVAALQAPTVITDAAGLQAIADDLAGDYVLGADIDLAGYPWEAIFGFSGTFDGNGHIVKNLTTDNTENRAGGLFGKTLEGSVVQNVGVVDVNITSGWYSAALVGDCFGDVYNCFAAGGTVTSITGNDVGNIGSFCGLVRETGSVTNCYSTVDVTFGEPGWANQGGFVGHLGGPVTNCYYAGVVTVAGEDGLGGGFFGNGEGSLTSSYFDVEVGGIASLDSAGSTTEGGLTTAEMMQESTYVGWDFADVWSIDEGQGYPQLLQPTVGPVGYWKLDETSGAIAQDSSGNGYDGILSADPDPVPVWTTDPGRGNVLEFVPGFDYVDCGPGVSAGQNLTVALWIKPADKELMRPISCFDGDAYSAGPGWFLMLRHDDWGEPPQIPPNAWFRITGGVDPETPEDAWNSGDLWINECWAPDEWIHMAFTFDEDTDTLSCYINGLLAGVTVVPESRGVASDTNPLIMGHGAAEEYQGLMEEVRIYDVVLTEAEIWDLVYPIAIPVPNGSFEQIYQPGSDTITADLGDGWTQGLGPDTPMDNGIATYSDGTTGDSVDILGWIGADPQGWVDNGGTYDRDPNFPNRQGSVARQSDTPDGLYYYLSNGGGWGNPAGGLIVSDAPVATVEGGLIYTLSMLANGGATPVVLELLADGVALTPSSSVDPELSGDWQEFSRTYDAASLDGHLGESLTILLGVGRGASGGQSHFDAVSLSYAPEPAAPTMEPITIDNPGFEDPVLGEDDYTWGDIPGWTLVGGEATGTEGSGVWNVTSADFDPVVAPEGENVLYTEYVPEGIAKGVAQVLTETFAADTDYMLTVEVGNAWYYYFGGYSVQLLAGGVVIAEDNDTLWPDYYTWATSTVEYTYDPADADLVGQPLEIRLLNLELDKDVAAPDVVGVEFDNVTLSYVPAPPAPPVSLIEDFDSLAVGTNMQDVDGWEGWYGDAQWAAQVTDAVAYSGTNSLEIVGTRDDLVPNWPQQNTGKWTLTVMQYCPSEQTTGVIYFGPLAAYDSAAQTIEWISEFLANFDTGKAYCTGDDTIQVDLVYDDWAELRLEVDLDAQEADFYYDNVFLATRPATSITGVDIWPSDEIVAIYYDDFRFEAAE